MNPNNFNRVKQTLQRLTFIVEQLSEGVAVTDLNGMIHFANPAMARMHGYGLCRELISKSITHLYSDDQIQTVLKSMIDTVRDHGNVQESMTHTRRDGSTFPAQTKMVLLNDEKGRVAGLIVLVTDLSPQTQQQSLAQHIEKLESANIQLGQQVHELRQVLHDSEELVPFDPNEYFGSPLSIRRLLSTAKRHPCQRQQPGAAGGDDDQDPNREQLSELADIAKLLKM